MSSTYTLNISNKVKHHFYDLMRQVHHNDENVIVEKAERTLQNHNDIEHTHYLHQRIETMTEMLTMMQDKQWILSKEYQAYILAALEYFAESNDIIPDDIPVIGYLDDCIVIDLVTEKVIDELRKYHEFSKTVKAYDLSDASNQVDLWQNLKRQELSSRIRHRRRRKTHKRNSNRRISFI